MFLSLSSFVFTAAALCAVFSVAQTVDDCLPYNFTLAALNLTLPNANSTGAPLVLGQAGAIDGAEFEVTSTYASFPYNDFPELALHYNSLRAYSRGGDWITNATQISSGEPLGWLTTTLGPPNAATGYTAIHSGGEYPELAVDGQYKLWFLCLFNNTRQINVVYNVSASASASSANLQYDPATCFNVKLNIVQLC